LGVSLDELLPEGEHGPHKRGPVSQIQRQMERISQLSKPKRRMLMEMLDALLEQQGR
jgi:hypothetical protein